MRTACLASAISPRWPGTVDTLALAAAFLLSILSPMAAIAWALGPMKTMPAFCQRQRETPRAPTGSRSPDARPRRRSVRQASTILSMTQVGLGRRRRADQHGLVGHLHVQAVAVGLGVDRHRLDAELARRLDDAAGDLAAVGDQDLLEHDSQPPCRLRDVYSPPPIGGKARGKAGAAARQARYLSASMCSCRVQKSAPAGARPIRFRPRTQPCRPASAGSDRSTGSPP